MSAGFKALVLVSSCNWAPQTRIGCYIDCVALNFFPGKLFFTVLEKTQHLTWKSQAELIYQIAPNVDTVNIVFCTYLN